MGGAEKGNDRRNPSGETSRVKSALKRERHGCAIRESRSGAPLESEWSAGMRGAGGI